MLPWEPVCVPIPFDVERPVMVQAVLYMHGWGERFNFAELGDAWCDHFAYDVWPLMEGMTPAEEMRFVWTWTHVLQWLTTDAEALRHAREFALVLHTLYDGGAARLPHIPWTPRLRRLQQELVDLGVMSSSEVVPQRACSLGRLGALHAMLHARDSRTFSPHERAELVHHICDPDTRALVMGRVNQWVT